MEDTLYDEIDVARDKLAALLELRSSGNMSDIGDYIDSLTEDESKIILRLIVYGAWRQF